MLLSGLDDDHVIHATSPQSRRDGHSRVSPADDDNGTGAAGRLLIHVPSFGSTGGQAIPLLKRL